MPVTSAKTMMPYNYETISTGTTDLSSYARAICPDPIQNVVHVMDVTVLFDPVTRKEHAHTEMMTFSTETLKIMAASVAWAKDDQEDQTNDH